MNPGAWLMCWIASILYAVVVIPMMNAESTIWEVHAVVLGMVLLISAAMVLYDRYMTSLDRTLGAVRV